MARPLLKSNGMLVANPPLTYVIYWGPRNGCDSLQAGHAALIIDSRGDVPGHGPNTLVSGLAGH
jgi:hypothetical protein